MIEREKPHTMINTSREATRSWPVVVAAILAIQTARGHVDFRANAEISGREGRTADQGGGRRRAAGQAAAGKEAPPAGPTRANLLRGEYGPYRANNDLLYYHLDVRVDPVKQTISGKNTIRFRMLKDDTRIQLDLQCRARRGQDPLRRRPAQVREGVRRGVRRFSRDAQGGPGLFDRLLLLGEAGLGGEVRRLGIPARTRRAGPGSTRRARCKAPASGGPTRTSGATRSNRWT